MNTQKFKISSLKNGVTVFGASFSAPEIRIASIDPNFEFAVSCHGEKFRADPRIANVTAGCRAISILSPVPLTLALPYDPTAVPEGQSEQEIRVFDLSRVASGGPMAPLDTYVDIENKKTLTTLKEQASHFINGVLKAGERPEKAPVSFSDEILKPVLEANPTAGHPLIAPPSPNTDGDLRLSYPLEFPGARGAFKPSVSIGYSAQSRSGNIADGWRLDVPSISVETRWGVPIYDDTFETETYVFNGDQLVPEGGSYMPTAQSGEFFTPSAPKPASKATRAETLGSDPLAKPEEILKSRLHLVPVPHRTTELREREREGARFVLRKGEGSWRFVRHGNTPADYWWEAWQENPSGDVKTLYFGNAPGRLPKDVVALPHVAASDTGEALLRKSWQKGGQEPIARWALARERDAHGNVIDYEWRATCTACTTGGLPEDRELYLRRVIYTHHTDIEETILRCQEKPDLPGCDRTQGLYEAHFNWENADKFQVRSEARSGGLTVAGLLLKDIAFRFRKRTTPLAEEDLGWACSAPFLGYAFKREADPLFKTKPGVEPFAGSRPRLAEIIKSVPDLAGTGLVSTSPDAIAFFPAQMGASCDTAIAPPGSTTLTSRFAYKTTPTNKVYDTSGYKIDEKDLDLAGFSQPGLGEELGIARGFVSKLVGSSEKGPYAPSFLGTSSTADLGVGVFLGVGFPTKAVSVGVNLQSSSRTAQTEVTSLLDVDGDGIADLLSFRDGRWVVHKGKLGQDLKLTFSKGAVGPSPKDGAPGNRLPHGFRFQYEPTSSTTNTGFEANIAPGMVGGTSGSGNTTQRHYLADMDGDGRIDVVTPNGVFYNTTNRPGAENTVTMAQASRFIASRTSATNAAVPPPVAKPPASPPAKPDLAAAAANAPLYDAVRVWKAPFAGRVQVVGPATYAGTDDGIKGFQTFAGAAPGTVNSPSPDDRLSEHHQARDGTMVSVEREHQGTVNLCHAGLLGPGVLTPPRVPTPDRDNLWRIEGSLFAREGTEAFYVLRLTGYSGARPARVRLVLENAGWGGAGGPTQAELDAAVDKARIRWKSPLGPEGGTLTSGNGEVTFAGNGEMWPLIIPLNVPKLSGGPGASFNIRLEKPSGETGSEPDFDPASASIRTGVFPAAFAPGGTNCTPPASGAGATPSPLDPSPLDPMTLDVAAGDILSFRVHSFDDGNGDAVNWNPEITYQETWNSLTDKTPLFPVPATSIAERSTACRAHEAPLGLCDGVGRSLIRYRATALRKGAFKDPARPPIAEDDAGDWPALVYASGEHVAPASGRFRFSGKFRKPNTPGILELAYAKLNKTHASCARDASGTYQAVRLKNGADFITATGLDAGEYEIDSAATGNVMVDAGERICLKFRLLIDQGVPLPHYTPYDAAGLDLFPDAPISLLYDRLSQLDRGQSQLAGTKPPEDAPDTECGKNPQPPSVPAGQTAKYSCKKMDLSIRLTPYAERGASAYFTAGKDGGKALQTDNPRPVLTPVTPWTTEPTPTSGLCKAGEVERRVRLDVSTLRPFNGAAEKLTLNTADQNFARLKIALRRYPAANGGLAGDPLKFRMFAARSVTPPTPYLSLTDEHLAYKVGSWTYVNSQQAEQTDVTIAFSRTDSATLIAPAPEIPVAGVVAMVPFETGAASPQMIEADKVGLAYCSAPDDRISVLAALDAAKPAKPANPPSPAQLFAETLIGADCVDRPQPPPNPPPATPVPPRIPAMCPLTSVALLSVEQVPGAAGATPTYKGTAHPLSIAMEPASDRFNRAGTHGLMPLTHRGANVVFPMVYVPADPAKRLCDAFGRDASGARANCVKSQADLAAVPRLKPLYALKMELPGFGSQMASELEKYTTGPFPANCQGNDEKPFEVNQCPVNKSIDSKLKIGAFAANTLYRPETARADATSSPGTAVSCLHDFALANAAMPKERYNVCGMGPDPAIFAHEEVISSSRLGMKNIHEGEIREAGMTQARQVVAAGQPAARGLQGADKRSTMTHWGQSSSVGLSSTKAHNVNNAQVDMIDMNGDGFPDLVSNGQITFTDPRGRIRCEQDGVWKDRKGCKSDDVNVGGHAVRQSRADSNSLTVNIMGIVNTYPTAKATAQGFLGSSSAGVANNAAPSSVMTAFGLGSMDFGNNKGARASDITDINGDGLPDLVRFDAASRKVMVKLNLGYDFSDDIEWPQAELFRDAGKNKGLSLGPPSFSTDNGAFSGGITTGTSASDQKQTVADINGDGLPDLIKFDDNRKIRARLGTGSGLTDWIEFGDAGVTAAGRTETDRVSTGGSYTFYYPIWPAPPISLIFNPNTSRSASLSRQTTLFRDMDGDGLPDVVRGEGLFAHNGNDFDFDKPDFNNKAADVRLNGLGQHGLLEKVWQASNHDPKSAANLEFDYTRTARTERDPHHRYVLFRTIVRDGVGQDDYSGAAGSPASVTGNARATCYFYTGGFHDRFERRFLGYRRVVTLDACDPHSAAPAIAVVDEKVSDDDISKSFKGIRRTVREYANASHYEAGLLLSEKTYDLTRSAAYISRSTVNTYVMMDTGRATHANRLCQRLRTPHLVDDFQSRLLKKGFVRDVFSKDASNSPPSEPECEADLTENNQDTHNDPSFDTVPRRLLPIKVQVVQEARESTQGHQILRTAMQFEYDYLGRPILACDLGSVTQEAGEIRTRGAICSGMTYDETVRPSFTHGATGGGAILIEQQNRIKQVIVATARPLSELTSAADSSDDPAKAPEMIKALLSGAAANDNLKPASAGAQSAGKVLRRRSAVHDPQTGALLALCAIEKPEARGNDPCAGYRHFPGAGSRVFHAQALNAASGAGIALRSYSYDRFGNILAFIGPVGNGGGFIRKDYQYDRYLSQIETAERTHLCTSSNTQGKEALCLDQASKLGALVSITTGIDYRFAAPTTTIDVNRNMSHVALDPLGRPFAMYLSSAPPGAEPCDKGDKCPLAATSGSQDWAKLPTKLGGIAALRKVAGLAYDSFSTGDTLTPRVVTTRMSEPTLYGAAAGTPVELKTATLTDHLGEKVQTISANTVCAFGRTDCEPEMMSVATPLVKKDALGRPITTGYAKGVQTPVEKTGVTDGTTPANTVSYDGLDRVRSVNLPDQNTFFLRYAIEASRDSTAPGTLRHVTYTRNAVCVPSAIERDVKGEIRAVIEAFEPRKTGDDKKPAPAGSAADGSGPQVVKNLVLKEVQGAEKEQQIAICASHPDTFDFVGLTTSVTGYDRDAMSQLVAVRLPLRTGEAQAKRQAIQIGYDGFGRRMALNDPDRGFERTLHDMAGNAVCRYASKRRDNLVAADLSLTEAERTSLLTGACPDPKGWNSSAQDITKRITTLYAANLPVQVIHEERGRDAGNKRSVGFTYGENDALALDCTASPKRPACLNQVGRILLIKDDLGELAKTYDLLGRTVATMRTYDGKKVARLEDVRVETTEGFDIWGLSTGRSVKATLQHAKKPVVFDQMVSQIHTIGGQLKAMSGTSRSVKDGVALSEVQPIIDDMRYDERGNLVLTRHATGVEARNRFDANTNRLLASASSVKGVAGTTADIVFQNLGYRYDAAGNVIYYKNAPHEIRVCAPEMPEACTPPVSAPLARQFGLLVSKSEHSFSYDQLNRLSRADKSATTILQGKADIGKNTALYVETSTDGEPQLFSAKELDTARRLELTVKETFDFQNTHEMTRHVQTTTHQRHELAFPEKAVSPSAGTLRSEKRTAVYAPSPAHRHAPATVRTSTPAVGTSTNELSHDTFGRLLRMLCTGNESCEDRKTFEWNADDTLRLQVARIADNRLSAANEASLVAKAKAHGATKEQLEKKWFSNRIASEFDHGGNRVYRSHDIALFVPQHTTPKARETLSDTIYADRSLTITRRTGEPPQAMAHYFAGGARVASQWLGEKHLFGYHSQLQTRNVSDVVVAQFEPPAGGTGGRILIAGSTRLHSQQEYAAFGRVVIEREMALDPKASKPVAGRKHPGLPAYRFNMKEEDDSGLQDFGARFYDNRLALWLRPDPVLHDYLEGRLNGGVFSPRNLASYGFGWGNPIAFIDQNGWNPDKPSSPLIALETVGSIANVAQKTTLAAAKCACGALALAVPVLGIPVTYGMFTSAVGDIATVGFELRGIYSRSVGDHYSAEKYFANAQYLDTLNDIVGGPTYLASKMSGASDSQSFSNAFYAATVSDLFMGGVSPKGAIEAVKHIKAGSHLHRATQILESVDNAGKIKTIYDLKKGPDDQNLGRD